MGRCRPDNEGSKKEAEEQENRTTKNRHQQG